MLSGPKFPFSVKKSVCHTCGIEASCVYCSKLLVAFLASFCIASVPRVDAAMKDPQTLLLYPSKSGKHIAICFGTELVFGILFNYM